MIRIKPPGLKLLIPYYFAISSFLGTNIKMHHDYLALNKEITKIGQQTAPSLENFELDLSKYIYDTKHDNVLILMGHHVRNNQGKTRISKMCTINPKNFYNTLLTLWENNYQTITLDQFYNKDFSELLPGKKPFVMTFDDAWQNQFNVIKQDGKRMIDPECAVGVINRFCDEHPEFGKHAMFFIDYDGSVPFGQEEHLEYKLNYLIDNGMEIGNHTLNHRNLGKCSLWETEYQLGSLMGKLEEVLGERIEEVKYIAYPYGVKPKQEITEEIEKNGVVNNGRRYFFEGAVLAYGNRIADPDDDPFHVIRHNMDDHNIEKLMTLNKDKQYVKPLYTLEPILEHKFQTSEQDNLKWISNQY